MTDRFNGCIIIDDPINYFDRFPILDREKILQNYEELLKRRCSGKIINPINILSKLHEEK